MSESNIITIKSSIRLWPSFWRHPIKHVRLKRFWKRAWKEDEEFLASSPLARRMRTMEDEVFLNGTSD